MKWALAASAVALLVTLLASAWIRRAEWGDNGESRSIGWGVALCCAAVAIIIILALAHG